MNLRSSFEPESGYALVTVLIVIAVILIFAAESASRVAREVRVTKTKEISERSFYVAEAGFNRARARIIKNASDTEILNLDTRTETILDSNNDPAGDYTLSVVQLAAAPAARSFKVVSTGTSSVGAYDAKRIISATITVVGTKPNGDLRVSTLYDP